MKKIALAALICALSASPAFAMSLSFEWGNLARCTDGNPNRVNNPSFKLSGVPAGTKKISFRMKDRDVPSYNHGGGTVDYKGNNIAPGAFKYKSPCPPDGRHTYEWKATAKDASGKTLGTATARKKYP